MLLDNERLRHKRLPKSSCLRHIRVCMPQKFTIIMKHFLVTGDLNSSLNSKLNEYQTKRLALLRYCIEALTYFRRSFDAKCLPSKTKRTGKTQNLSGRVLMPKSYYCLEQDPTVQCRPTMCIYTATTDDWRHPVNSTQIQDRSNHRTTRKCTSKQERSTCIGPLKRRLSGS